MKKIVAIIGILTVGAFCATTSFVILFTLKKTTGIRVSEIEEIEGLYLHEYGMSAYIDFRMNEH